MHTLHYITKHNNLGFKKSRGTSRACQNRERLLTSCDKRGSSYFSGAFSINNKYSPPQPCLYSQPQSEPNLAHYSFDLAQQVL